ncbi:MAG: 2,4-dichlorophenoxyacetate dioxygenase [Rhodospirillales bacterium]|jgi:alpha-ketoglutarate-dependent 2,4-dichlorophenoxyacetate dioxygenase|nr:2,4-dichlorophenoxyacetate dioxygenase [Rhodospirillales bacterium]
MSITVNPLNSSFFAEIGGVDLGHGVDPATLGEIEAALARYAVVVFHDQKLSDDEQIAFSQQLGRLSYALNPGREKGQTARLRHELYDISNLNEKHDVLADDDRRRMYRLGDRLWHTDRSFVAAPTTYSLLSAREVPPIGGNTDFADMRAAYDVLPEAMKSRIDGLVAEHSVWYSRGLAGFSNFREDEIAAMPPATQPLIRVHPRSGRKSLVLASHASHIVGWPVEEGRALLRELTEFATEPQFVHSHVWRAADLVIWDNRCTMHRGTDYDDVTYRRDLRRTTVEDAAA